MLIKDGFVLDFDRNDFVREDILIRQGRIAAIGDHLEDPEGETVSAEGRYIMPGLIDAHSHIGISEEGLGDIGDDCCDYSSALTPELEVIDAINPFDRAIRQSIASGVTAACVCPGSDGVVGGVASVMTFRGQIINQMMLRRYAAMKCALGENPKNAGHGFKSRMGVAYHLRKCLDDAVDYGIRKKQAQREGDYFRKDRGMENMQKVLLREMPIHVHAHRADDICTAIRIAEEYDIDLVLIHATDGIRIKDYLAEKKYPVMVGPSMGCRSKQEIWNKTFETAGVLANAGLTVCITADHDVTPLYYLPVYAATAVRYGMNSMDALKAVTCNPADVLGIGDKKGNLKPGYDADIVIWNKPPLSTEARADLVLIEGAEMYRRC